MLLLWNGIIDIRIRLLTNKINFILTVSALMRISVMKITGSIRWQQLVEPIIFAILMTMIFVLLNVFCKGAVGYGDIKTCIVICVSVPYSICISAICIGFILGGVYGMYLYIKNYRKNDMADETIPMGMFLFSGVYISLIADSISLL